MVNSKLEVMSKEEAVILVQNATKNAKKTGLRPEGIIANTRRRADGHIVCEVGDGSKRGIIVTYYGDILVKSIKEYKEALS